MPSQFILCIHAVIFAVESVNVCAIVVVTECVHPCSGTESEILNGIRDSLSVATEELSDSSSGEECSSDSDIYMYIRAKQHIVISSDSELHHSCDLIGDLHCLQFHLHLYSIRLSSAKATLHRLTP